MSRTTLRLSTGQTVRVEESEHYKVHTGRIVVTDANGTSAYGEDDEFTVAPKGGASIYCLEQAIAYAYTPAPKPKKKATKKASKS